MVLVLCPVIVFSNSVYVLLGVGQGRCVFVVVVSVCVRVCSSVCLFAFRLSASMLS